MSEKLPKGWAEVDLDKILIYSKGKKPKTLSQKKADGLVPYINIKAFEQGVIDEFADVKSSKLICKTDILVVWDGARFGLTGKGMEGAAGSTLMVLTPVLIDPEFLFHFINRHYSYINSKPKGTGTPHVNPDIFWKLKFPIAPLSEQKRIIAKLDQIIPRIDLVKERLNKIPAIIKRFRQSVLTAAVAGKLTEQWRAKHSDFDSPVWIKSKYNKIIPHEEYRNEWNNIDIPEHWNCLHLKEIADLRLGKMLDGIKNTGVETKYIRNVNVRWFQFELDDLKTIRLLQEEVIKLSIKNGDVFICEGGEPGRAAVWQSGENKMTFQKALHRVRFHGNVEPYWLVYNLKLDADTDRLSRLFTGSTIKHFTGRSLADYPLLLPPLEEQEEIVRQVDKLFAIADKLESHYQKAKARVDNLSQSILAKAFRGELVITEAELVEREGRDFESAEKLLDRILEEKAKLSGNKKSTVIRRSVKDRKTQKESIRNAK